MWEHGDTMNKLPFLALAVFFVPFFAFAHTKWFAHGSLPPYVTNEPTVLYLAVWGAIALIMVAVGTWLEKKQLLQLDFIRPKGAHAFDRAASVVSMVAGAFLMIAATHEYFFSPNLSLESGVPMFLIYAQFAVGLSFLLGVFARISALLLAGLWLAGVLVSGLEPMLENVWVLSTAAFAFIMGNDYFSIVKMKVLGKTMKKFEPYAIPILRVGTGATLLILGFTEKILNPQYGINFLKQYDWNFMANFGLPFSDYLFTISAGVVEALFGLVFILGIVTRVNAVALAVFFSIPLFLLGPVELAGHVPHFAAVILLLLFGSGEHWKLIRK